MFKIFSALAEIFQGGQAVESPRPELSNELVTFEQIIADLRTYAS